MSPATFRMHGDALGDPTVACSLSRGPGMPALLIVCHGPRLRPASSIFVQGSAIRQPIAFFFRQELRCSVSGDMRGLPSCGEHSARVLGRSSAVVVLLMVLGLTAPADRGQAPWERS